MVRALSDKIGGIFMLKRKSTIPQTHLSLEQRKIIQAGIENNSTKSAIAQTIGKDATTVAKEIRRHRKFRPRNTFNTDIPCENRKWCSRKPCVKKCEDFVEIKCNRRDKSPGACNKCPKVPSCKLDKYFYSAVQADADYHYTLVDSREGINLTTLERAKLAEIIAIPLKNGQSVNQVLTNHPEITQGRQTMYNYIETGVFKDFGIDCFTLKEQVNRKRFKNKFKKRKEPVNYEGRRFEDFLQFRAENPDVPCVEMDTVYNSPSGPYLQTFLFENTAFMIGFMHKEKTSASMAETFNYLQDILGNELFYRLFSLILTDRGTEFQKYDLFERDKNGDSRLRIFYCDPMQSNQKPHVENNHNFVRDIIPNGYPLSNITNGDIEQMFSHINSAPRRSLGDKTPYEVFTFQQGEDVAHLLNITKIEKDSVILKPKLIFNKSNK